MRREEPRSKGRQSLWAATLKSLSGGVHSYPE
jgi:hypothetical protein